MKISELQEAITEVSHKVGMAAGKALTTQTVSPQQQATLMQKFKDLVAKEQELASRPDSATGKYAKEFQNLNRQKTKVARAGNLNAFGEPLSETATSGGTSAGSIATLPQHQGAVIRRPNLFGYVPGVRKTTSKPGKKSSPHK